MKSIQLLIGGAGFIGNALIRGLLKNDNEILCIDDDTSGNFEQTRKDFFEYNGIKFYLGDINNQATISWIKAEAENKQVTIWHLAANSDIKSGSSSPNLDAYKTFMTTVSVCNLLDEMNVKYVNFASTSAVYGELGIEESFGENSECSPISYYGIAKQSSEKFLEIKSNNKDVPLLIFRFANIVGAPATHGVLFDLINRIKVNPVSLEVLGNGEQTKSYLHVEKLVEMMLTLWSNGKTGVYNLGPGDFGISVREIAKCLVDHLPHQIPIKFGSSPRGWDGDAVKVLISTLKYESIFPSSKLRSSDAIHQAIHDVSRQLDFEIICPSIEISAG